MSEELTTERLEALRSIEDANIITPSTAHMEAEELRAGVHQMVEDLYRLATQDGCIAAAWALEALGVQVAEIERLRREREMLAAAVMADSRLVNILARVMAGQATADDVWRVLHQTTETRKAALALLDGEKGGGGT